MQLPKIARPIALCAPLLLAVAHFSASATAAIQARDTLQIATPSSVPTLNISTCCLTPLDATAFALIYGFPLKAFISFAGPILKTAGTNVVQSQTQLATPQETAVVKPNVDTIYTYAVLDFSATDVVVEVPQISEGRYWDFAFYDLFGNNYANIGSVNNSAAGSYLLQRADDVPRPSGLHLLPAGSKHEGTVNSPTTYGSMLVRIEVLQNTTAELDTIHGYQKRITMKTIPRVHSQPNTPQAPSLLSVAAKATSLPGSAATQLLELLAIVAPFNGPIVKSDTARVNKNLALAGISDGKYNPPLAVAVPVAEQIANKTITVEAANPLTFQSAGNGWLNKLPSVSGSFGTHYTDRAVIAHLGYLELVASQQLYPIFVGSFVASKIGANQAFLLTFSGVPPIPTDGFWSVTAYNGQQFLIPNSLNRYELGNRSNLTYSDGTPVYGAGAPATTTEPFQLLIQPANVPPPANWTNNWLPAPSGGGELSFLLRFAAPTAAFSDGSYVYPEVALQQAITSN